MTARLRFLLLLAGLLGSVAAGPMAAGERAPGDGNAALGGTVIVVNQASDTVTLIDLATMQAYRHVTVVGGPHEVAVSPDGRRAIVSNYRKRGAGPQKALSLISLPDGEVLKTIDLGQYRAPHDVHWVDAGRVVTTVEDNQALLLVDVETGAVERVFNTGRDGSHMLALSPDRRRLFSSNMGHRRVPGRTLGLGRQPGRGHRVDYRRLQP